LYKRGEAAVTKKQYDREVQLVVKGSVATITIHHPPVNILNKQVLEELSDCLRELETMPGLHCVILTGTGRSFIAGGDIQDFQDISIPDFEALTKLANDTFTCLERFPVPVIAAINGYAFGGGLELALACDIRIAAESASLSLPEAGIGMIPSYGGTARLTKLISPGYAKYLMFSGRRITAQKACAIGLVQEVVEDHELMAVAETLARDIASKSPVAIQYIKYLVNQTVGASMKESLSLEAAYATKTVTGNEFREGIAAFLEKRPASFGEITKHLKKEN
jgi:enoyl-CoA hydratase